MTGFSVQNLWLARQFFLEYRDAPILQQLVGEIPWGHNVLIIQKVKSEISLRTKTNPIGVSTYELYPQIPDAYKGKLPTAQELQKLLNMS